MGFDDLLCERKAEPATGYETLIYDCLIGDQTLFKRADDIEFAWRAVAPFLAAWRTSGEVHGHNATSALNSFSVAATPAGSVAPSLAAATTMRPSRRVVAGDAAALHLVAHEIVGERDEDVDVDSRHHRPCDRARGHEQVLADTRRECQAAPRSVSGWAASDAT